MASLSWINSSYISTGTTLLMSTDGTTFFEEAEVGAGVTGGSITGVELGTQYWVKVLSQGVNGISDASAAMPVTTAAATPTLVVTPDNQPTEGQQFSLNLSASYADDLPTSDWITGWLVNFGDGRGVQTYSATAGDSIDVSSAFASPVAWTTVQITAVEASGAQVSYPSQTLGMSPSAPTALTGSYAAGNGSVTLNWHGQSTITSAYRVQEWKPGATAWTDVAWVTADSDGTDQSYSSTVTLDSSDDSGLDSFQIVADGSDSSTGSDDQESTTTDTGICPDGSGDDDGGGEGGGSSDPYTIAIGPVGVTVGGEAYADVWYNGDSSTELSISSTNPDVLAVLDPTVTDQSNDGPGFERVLVEGDRAGETHLVATDGMGARSETGAFGPSLPQVQVIGSANITEGASYAAGSEPGFQFTILSESETAVQVHYTLPNSTLPASMMPGLTSGMVTFEPHETSVIIPVEPGDDGMIAAMREIVLQMEIPGVKNGEVKIMNVFSPDTPVIKINGASDNAAVTIDQQGDDGKLATISMSETAAGKIKDSTLTWNPSEFTIWLTDHVGNSGTDLGSDPKVTHDITDGTVSYSWPGKPPSTLYGQGVGGSADWDRTNIMLSTTVEQAGNEVVGDQLGDASNHASGTINGPELYWNGNPVSDIQAGPIFIGTGVILTAVYLGPRALQPTQTQRWSVEGSPITGVTLGMQPTFLSDDPEKNNNLTSDVIAFYWFKGAGPVSNYKVGLAMDVDGKSYYTSTHFKVFAPDSTAVPDIFRPTFVGPSNDADDGYADVSYSIPKSSVSASGEGIYAFNQVIVNVGIAINGGGLNYTAANVNDGGFPYPNTGTADGIVREVYAGDNPDVKGIVDTATKIYINEVFADTLMFKPSAPNAIWVPLRKNTWGWNVQKSRASAISTYWTDTDPMQAWALPFQTTSDYPTWSGVRAG